MLIFTRNKKNLQKNVRSGNERQISQMSQLDSHQAIEELKELSYGNLVDGYWHGQPGIEALQERQLQRSLL